MSTQHPVPDRPTEGHTAPRSDRTERATRTADDPVVRVSCVRHTYEGGVTVHLCGLDFVAHRGTRTALLGPNGSGKTTMLYHILGLLRTQEGEVSVFGVDPASDWPSIRQRIGVVLQNVGEQLIAPTVREDVGFSPQQYGLSRVEIDERVDRALSLVGIAHLADRVPHNLSGGEKRKVALAGALVMDPELLVLDEPLEGLDPAARSEIVGLLDRLSAKRGTTVILTTHDIDAVPEVADAAYVLAPGGEIALEGTPRDVFEQARALPESNIRPPVLATLFDALRARDQSAPPTAMTVDEAVTALLDWRGRRWRGDSAPTEDDVD
jgi:cobalt/nickel transport system ATP-binding protein